MPVETCRIDGKPGFRWGDTGKCYTYTPSDTGSRNRAKEKAARQGSAIKSRQSMGTKIPLILKDRIVLREGKWNGLFYPADVIKSNISILNSLPDSDDVLARNRTSLFYDHDDKSETWLGEIKNFQWDDKEKAIRGDIWIIDQACAEKIDYQTKHGLSRWGISPKMQVKTEGKTVTELEFITFAIVIYPAGGSPLMLEQSFLYQDLDFGNAEIIRKSLFVPFSKYKKEEGIVYGIVLEPDIPDSHGDPYSKGVIAEAAHFWMEEYQKMGVQHRDHQGRIIPVADDSIKYLGTGWEKDLKPVESFVAPVGFNLDGKPVREGSWVLGVKILNEEIRKAVKNKELDGFSIGCLAIKEIV